MTIFLALSLRNPYLGCVGGKRPDDKQERKELVIPKEKVPNYSAADEAAIRAASEEGTLNATSAAALASQLGKSSRSVIAKIIRMGLPYERKQPTTKNGDPITSKAKLVEAIGSVVAGNLDGLDKAPKPALRALADFVASRSGTEG